MNTYTNSHTLVPGYNKILFPWKYFSRKGMMIYFEQINGGATISVACNTSSSGSILKYSDYAMNTNNYTVSNLNEILNPSSKPNTTCAFEMNFIIEYPLYNATTRFNKTYANSSIFQMNASYTDYNVTTVYSVQSITVWGEWSTWVSEAALK